MQNVFYKGYSDGEKSSELTMPSSTNKKGKVHLTIHKFCPIFIRDILSDLSKKLHIRTSLFINGVLLVSIFFISCGIFEPEQPDYHNKILFSSRRSGKFQLYMMNPDGTDIEQITSGEYWHNFGKWSPNAQKIVCNTEEETTTAGMEMVVMNTDGSERKLLGMGNQMSWYPDGSKIIFSYWPGAEVAIFDIKLYSVGSNGKNMKVLSDKYVGNHTISPDGQHIAFPMDHDSSTGITILDFPGFDNPKYIGPFGLADAEYSRKGDEIAFSRHIGKELITDIYIINSDGSNLRKITNSTSEKIYIEPCWSPDGDRIIFIENVSGINEEWFLYMINKDGTDLNRVIDDNTVRSCDWSK